MIQKKLLFSVKESIPYIKKNIIYQWIGLLCNMVCIACLCFMIVSQPTFFNMFVYFFLILRYYVNSKAVEMSYQSSSIVKKTVTFSFICKIIKNW